MVTNKKLIWSIVIVTIIFIVLVGRNYATAFFLERGIAAFKSEDAVRAKINITIASILSPRNPIVLTYVGHLARGIKPDLDSEYPYHDSNFEKAVRAYEKAFSFGLQNKDPQLYFSALDSAALSYWELGEYDKALNLFLKEIELYPQDAFWARYFVAFDYFNRLDKPADALNYLTTITNQPRAFLNIEKNAYKRIYLSLARLHLYFENYEDAKKSVMIVIRAENPKTDEGILETAHLYLAYIEGKNKNFAVAETHMQEVKKIGESTELFECGLAYAHFLGGDYKTAYEFAMVIKNFENRSSQLLCLRVLGESLYAMNDKTNAREYFEEYIKLSEQINNKNSFLIRNREKFKKYLEEI